MRRLDRRGLENRPRRGIGAALDRHVAIGPGAVGPNGVARIVLVDGDRRRPGHVGAGIDEHHVVRCQFIGVDDRLQAGFRLVRREAVVGVVADRRAIDVPVRAGIVHVVRDHAFVAQHERRQGGGRDERIFHAVDAPQAERGTAIGFAVPRIAAGGRRPAAHDVGPTDSVVRRVLDAHRVVGGGAAGGPAQIDEARGCSAIDERNLGDPSAQGRFAGLRRAAMQADVHPAAVWILLRRPRHGLRRPGIDQGRGNRIDGPAAAGQVAPPAAHRMVIAAAGIGQQRILRQGMDLLPRGHRPGGHGCVRGRARREPDAQLQRADRRVGASHVHAVVIALVPALGRIRDGVEREGSGPHHAEHVVRDPDKTVVLMDPVPIGPKHGRREVHGTEPGGVQRHARVLVPGQDHVRQIDVRGIALDR